MTTRHDVGRIELEIITPSYAPDLELCVDLAASVARYAPEGTLHTVIVPPSDVALFQQRLGAGRAVRSTSEFLPQTFWRIPGVNLWLNLRSPWPPVRGWIAQQVVKLAATASSSARAVLLADSDLQFIAPFDLTSLAAVDEIPLYRLPDAIHERMPRHVAWDATARRMLGVPVSKGPPLPDYICWPCLWDPTAVRDMLAEVERVTRRPWQTVVGRELQFSEMVLYGVYVDCVESLGRPRVQNMHCPSYSDERELSAPELEAFLAGIRPDDIAVMISAKSGTDLALRRALLSDPR